MVYHVGETQPGMLELSVVAARASGSHYAIAIRCSWVGETGRRMLCLSVVSLHPQLHNPVASSLSTGLKIDSDGADSGLNRLRGHGCDWGLGIQNHFQISLFHMDIGRLGGEI